MLMSEIVEHSSAFEQRLHTIRQESRVDFDWYPFNSLGNFIHLRTLLEQAGLDDFFDRLPKDKKMLDMGCADGEIAFFFEHQGFKVDAIDRAATNFNDLKGFHFLHRYFNSAVSLFELDIDRNITLEEDYSVTFALGLLYHLRNPFYTLNLLCLHSEYVLISTRIISHAPDGTLVRNLPVSYLVSKDEMNNDATNYWIFSRAGIRRIVERAGFDTVCELQVGSVDDSTPHQNEKDERYFALLKRKENYKDIFVHHGF